MVSWITKIKDCNKELKRKKKRNNNNILLAPYAHLLCAVCISVDIIVAKTVSIFILTEDKAGGFFL